MLFLWTCLICILVFMWIFLLPIFIIGFLFSIPFFVFALPVSLMIGGTIYLCYDHIKESSIRDIITNGMFEFAQFWFGPNTIVVPNKRALICCHPHGVLCTIALVGIHFRPKSKTLIAVAPLFFTVPVIGWLAKHLGAIPASYESIKKALQHTSVVLIPGGVPEIICLEQLEQYTKRWGFLKLAKECMCPIVSICGKHNYYDLLPMPFYDLRKYLSNKIGIPIVFPWVFGWMGTWLPKRKPMEATVFEFEVGDDIEESRKLYYERTATATGVSSTCIK